MAPRCPVVSGDAVMPIAYMLWTVQRTARQPDETKVGANRRRPEDNCPGRRE
jgi:hypothetical protein